MRVLLGLAPTGRGDFWGSDTFARLCRYTGVPEGWWREHCEFWNAYDLAPGRASPAHARLVARRIADADVLALGGEAGRAVAGSRVCAWAWWSYAERGDGSRRAKSLAVVPHPSGANRLYNEPGAREQLRRFVELWRSRTGD